MRRALVLGGGGLAGIAWELGVLNGLRQTGADLRDADLIVGTSAGAVVGALIATGADLTQAARDGGGPLPVPPMDPSQFLTVLAVLFDPALAPQEARRRVGRMALAAALPAEADIVAAVAARLPAADWPERELKVTAVDAETGEFVVWDRRSGVPLVPAVAASCAVPCVFPPVEIAGRRYLDGGIRTTTNADLAQGTDAVVVLAPMAHLTPRPTLDAELAALGTEQVGVIVPDERSQAAFGTSLLSAANWAACHRAGLEQGAAAADTVLPVWGRSVPSR